MIRRVHLGVWQRFRAKSAAEQRAVLWALAVGPLVKVTLRTRGYAATVRLLERFQRSPSAGDSECRARAAESAMHRIPFPMTCLDRSLVVWWLLGGAPDAVIRFGVAPGSDGGAPKFHAWVVADGMALDFDTEHLDTFLPLESPGGIQPERFD
ncbi:MAG: lasso peptide biosynthesis B2 protein [Acidimicrobiia bacterium]